MAPIGIGRVVCRRVIGGLGSDRHQMDPGLRFEPVPAPLGHIDNLGGCVFKCFRVALVHDGQQGYAAQDVDDLITVTVPFPATDPGESASEYTAVSVVCQCRKSRF